jgi:hypothetical protein
MEALGVRELGKAVFDFLSKTSRSGLAILHRVAQAIRERRYGEAAYYLARFLRWLIAVPTLAALEKAIGSAAVRRLAIAITVRFVPIIGTGYAVGCLLAAIYRNLDRLAKARFS